MQGVLCVPPAQGGAEPALELNPAACLKSVLAQVTATEGGEVSPSPLHV